MGGMILSALVHPWFYVLLAYDLWNGRLLGVPGSAFGQWLLGVGIFNLIAGYVSAIALGTIAAARRGRRRLAAHALLMPVYWLAISYAAYRALWQLIWAPYYWEKTEHAARGAEAPAEQTAVSEIVISQENGAELPERPLTQISGLQLAPASTITVQ
jgi:hypothetical protein